MPVPLLRNCTFYANIAEGVSGFGGAIYNNAVTNGEEGITNCTVVNCIFNNNYRGTGASKQISVFRNVNSSPIISYSLVDLADCATLDDRVGPRSVGMQSWNDLQWRS